MQMLYISWGKENKEQGSGRQKMSNDVTFKFSKILGGREAESRKGVPHVWSARRGEKNRSGGGI